MGMQVKAKVRQIRPLNLFHFSFDTAWDMNMTLVRIQEFYESPKFRNKHFTLEQYMDWYAETEAKKNKDGTVDFDYTSRVYGLNFPGKIVKSFIEKFDAGIRPREQWFLDRLSTQVDIEDDNYYVIGTFGTCSEEKETLDHEIRHGMYYLLPKYRREINKVLDKHWSKTKTYRKDVLRRGYGKSVLKDEMHAFALTGWPEWDHFRLTKSMKALKKDLKVVERKWIKELNW